MVKIEMEQWIAIIGGAVIAVVGFIIFLAFPLGTVGNIIGVVILFAGGLYALASVVVSVVPKISSSRVQERKRIRYKKKDEE